MHHTGRSPRGVVTPRRALGTLAALAALAGACSGDGARTAGSAASAVALDPDFGRGGLATTALGGVDDEALALTVLADGRAVLAGEARPDARSLRGFALARYLPNGALDPSFGGRGVVHTAFSESQGSGARAVVALPDGRLVAVGHAVHPTQHHDGFAVVRYLPDGQLDATFGEGGGVITAVDPETGAGRNDVARAVAVQGDGRIVVVGETGGAFKDIAVVRYNPDGSLDTGFGDGGGVVTDLGGNDGAAAVAIQSDGRIVVGGSGSTGGSHENFAVVRYLPDGRLDASFGDGGRVTTDFRGGTNRGEGLVLRPDGRIVLGGVAQLSGGCRQSDCERYGLAVAQYTPDGRLDASFGDGGRTLLDLTSSSGGYALTRLADGHLVLAGHVGNEDFAVAMLRDDGKPETSFGDGGVARTSFGDGADRAFAAGATRDGGFFVGGSATVETGTVFALARYRPR